MRILLGHQHFSQAASTLSLLSVSVHVVCVLAAAKLPYIQVMQLHWGWQPLFILGYCRNMVVQHGSLRGSEPAPYVDIKGSF